MMVSKKDVKALHYPAWPPIWCCILINYLTVVSEWRARLFNSILIFILIWEEYKLGLEGLSPLICRCGVPETGSTSGACISLLTIDTSSCSMPGPSMAYRGSDEGTRERRNEVTTSYAGLEGSHCCLQDGQPFRYLLRREEKKVNSRKRERLDV